MKLTEKKDNAALAVQLADFLLLVLQLVPTVLWWLLATLVFAVVNLIFIKEVWPNTPKAEYFLVGMLSTSLLLLVWMASSMAWRIANHVKTNSWSVAWRLAAVLGFLGATGITAMALVALSIHLLEKLA
ncbi:hypothetical protein [Hymenobacter crusticola]|nr:hypothetical protein [Hymenobacter crusticola]